MWGVYRADFMVQERPWRERFDLAKVAFRCKRRIGGIRLVNIDQKSNYWGARTQSKPQLQIQPGRRTLRLLGEKKHHPFTKPESRNRVHQLSRRARARLAAVCDRRYLFGLFHLSGALGAHLCTTCPSLPTPASHILTAGLGRVPHFCIIGNLFASVLGSRHSLDQPECRVQEKHMPCTPQTTTVL